ncbi:unnamed protein product [Schistosoma curassoni]|uniref:Uncharacterized protein n=1 Tax=Schistosoma curassoni TaxID=6186 RepID=A0A183JCP4_9TREM|nr:unnamed protein product [Schistosoma curassoni]
MSGQELHLHHPNPNFRTTRKSWHQCKHSEISARVICPLKSKKAAIVDYPEPTTVKQLCTFNVLASICRLVIPNCASSMIGHTQEIFKTTVDFAASNIESCNSDPIKLSVSNYHPPLSTTSENSVEPYGSPELNETRYHCETKASSQSTSSRISHIIVLDLVCPNDSHISDEISYKSEENMLNELNHDEKSDAVLIDAYFSDDRLPSNDILDKFDEKTSEE